MTLQSSTTNIPENLRGGYRRRFVLRRFSNVGVGPRRPERVALQYIRSSVGFIEMRLRFRRANGYAHRFDQPLYRFRWRRRES